jgi:hypothetical protein
MRGANKEQKLGTDSKQHTEYFGTTARVLLYYGKTQTEPMRNQKRWSPWKRHLHKSPFT